MSFQSELGCEPTSEFQYDAGKIPLPILRAEAEKIRQRRRQCQPAVEPPAVEPDLRETDRGEDGSTPPAVSEYGSGPVGLSKSKKKKINPEVATQAPPPTAVESPPVRDTSQDPPIGLSLSSGGLRSCTFTLGFVQALHHHGKMKDVDYISSVSGGGFVAGHVTSLADKLRYENHPAQGQSLHAHAGEAGDVLGVKKCGQILPCFRFSAVGEYLFGSPGELLPLGFRYLCSTVPLVICTVAPIGFLMTLAALFWRSFDYPPVRTILTLLGADIVADQMNWGEDAFVSYLPAFLLTALLLVYGATIALLGLVHSLFCWRTTLLGQLVKAGGVLVVLTVVAWVMSSVAYFSNGWSDAVNSDVGLTLQSWTNHYATYLSMLLTLPFVFSRRLADSAKASAPTWQRIFSRIVVSTVLTCTPLVLFYWMVRENISEHVDHRKPDLVRGDVLDWPRFANLDDELGISAPKHVDLNYVSEKFPDPSMIDPASIGDFDLLPSADAAKRYEEMQSQMHLLQLRALLRPILTVGRNRTQGGELPTAEVCYLQHVATQDRMRSEYVETHWNRWLSREPATIRLLKELGERQPQIFEDPIVLKGNLWSALWSLATQWPLANQLAGGAASPDNSTSDPVSRAQGIEEFLVQASTHPRFPLAPTEVSALRAYLELIVPGRGRDGVPISEDYYLDQLLSDGSLNDPVDKARLHRLLLETLYPDVIRKRMMVSTPLTVAHDQEVRGYWLLGWWLAVMCGWLINANLHSPLYEYYRSRLVRSFLSPSVDVTRQAEVAAQELESSESLTAAQIQARKVLAASRKSFWPGRSTPRLAYVEPWHAGAPFPIFVATMSLFQRLSWMPGGNGAACRSAEDVSQSALADDIPPMTFTPLHSGSYALGYRSTKAYCGGELSLEDAVALSGAPITPMVTKSLPMRLTLGMVNARLGMWLPLPSRQTALGKFPAVNLPNVFATMMDTAPENQPRQKPAESQLAHQDRVMLEWLKVIGLWVFLVLGGGLALSGMAGWAKDVAEYSALGVLTFFSYAVTTLAISAMVMVFAVGLLYPIWSWSWLRLPFIVGHTAGGHLSTWGQSLSEVVTGPIDFRPVVDGCFHDPFGIEELLLRRCARIYIVDGGRNNDEWQMTALSEALRMMEERHGIRIQSEVLMNELEPHAELLPGKTPPDLRIQQSHFIKIVLGYPPGRLSDDMALAQGLLRQTDTVEVYYCQMSLTGDEPLDVLNYARRTKSFPNEPNSNQFFTADQSETFRRLGYHIGEKLCASLTPGAGSEGAYGITPAASTLANA